MCGIAGFISPKNNGVPLEASARAMAAAIRHRGPDDEGVWIDPAANIALAHRRLSIVDLSPAGHQPFVSASGRYVLVFNGEIYNHAELRRALEEKGQAPQWRGHSDTEVLLEAIAAWGIDAALHMSAGMFAFALWDRSTRTLTLARDRLGEKPLYFGWAGGTFLFGSELAALRCHPAWIGEIDRQSLALMMRFNNVPAPRSIYRGIAKLRPGTYIVLPPGAREGKEHVYWDAGRITADGLDHPFAGTAEDAVHDVERLLRQSLAGQMLADVPLGAFLSGGVDSSLVVALMQDMSAKPVKTFSIGFGEAGYDESRFAGAVARHLGTDHHEFNVTSADALAVIPKLASIYSEPFADSSQIPTYLVAELARRHVTVSLSGDGGDEIFSGYRRYQFAARTWPMLARVPRPLRAGTSKVILGIKPRLLDTVAALGRALLPGRRGATPIGDKLHKAARVMGLDSPDDVYRTLVSHWQDPGKIVVGAGEEARSLDLPPDHAGADPVRRMMVLDMLGYLPDDILVKVDRAAMAVSLESRVPLLDHRLVEFASTLPVEILRRHGQSKWPLRQILYKHVPRDMIERPKAGFAVPLAAWLRGPLRDWAENLMGERRLESEGYLRSAPIRDAWGQLLAGAASNQERIWNVLMFQAWLDSTSANAGHLGPLPAAASAT